MFAHEEWEYDDANGVATVVGVALLCQDCNSVTHFGRVPSEYDEHVLAHFARVSGVTADEVKAQLREAKRVWMRRSLRPWIVAVAPAVAERFPDMAKLPERATRALAGPTGTLVLRARRGAEPDGR